MRVQVSVNNSTPVRASLNSKGWLGVHLNLSTNDGATSSDASFFIHAIDYSQEPNSVSSRWDLQGLQTGDTAKVEVLDDGETDSPTKVERSTERSTNLFSNIDRARQLLSAISACDKELNAVLERSQASEPEDEFKKIALAIAGIVVELDRNLIQPTIRRHPELLAEAQEMRLI